MEKNPAVEDLVTLSLYAKEYVLATLRTISDLSLSPPDTSTLSPS
jgi:hypothetical protein